MIDLSTTRGRMVAMIAVDGLATVIAGASAYAAVSLHQNVYWGMFGAAVIAGFAANIWFIAGLRRAKQGD
jgi:hypothetical protein